LFYNYQTIETLLQFHTAKGFDQGYTADPVHCREEVPRAARLPCNGRLHPPCEPRGRAKPATAAGMSAFRYDMKMAVGQETAE